MAEVVYCSTQYLSPDDTRAIASYLGSLSPPARPATAVSAPYGMQPFFDRLGDEEVAAVLTYVRASWGNGGAPVSTLDVEKYR
jgi:mono/diheme cytochrome c family protein